MTSYCGDDWVKKINNSLIYFITAGDKTFFFPKARLHNEIYVPNELVQIAVVKSEIKKRITCYLQKKRDEINQNNIIDYRNINHCAKVCEGTQPNFMLENSCARVNSTVVKQDSSKCLLKVCRVKNDTGPQTRPNYIDTLDKLMAEVTPMKYFGKDNDYGKISVIGKRKRMESIEQHLFHSSKFHLPMNLRLKQAEDRILHLESLSPEYWHFIVNANHFAKISKEDNKYIKDNTGQKYGSLDHRYTVEELNFLILRTQSAKHKVNM